MKAMFESFSFFQHVLVKTVRVNLYIDLVVRTSIITGWASVPYLLNFIATYRHYQYEPQHYKTNKMSVRAAKTQISLGIRPV